MRLPQQQCQCFSLHVGAVALGNSVTVFSLHVPAVVPGTVFTILCLTFPFSPHSSFFYHYYSSGRERTRPKFNMTYHPILNISEFFVLVS
jgi:hypothetical protein